MQTYEANLIALGGCAKSIRAALKKLGMRRCSLRLVYYQCSPRDLRLDWYGVFWRWCEALWLANREGAEFLFEDLFARICALRSSAPTTPLDLDSHLAMCEREHSDIIRAAFLHDIARMKREIGEDIRAKQLLLEIIEAQERRSAAA